MRGLDMALEEGLNVKLVLIPDNEDPDSYVRKVGAWAFNDFINKNKKDFILFQSEILLKEAGNDINKKSEVVNQLAESLSKINKAEDFSKLQDYIKQCAALLKIDEGGLTTLVNKHKRERIAKEERFTVATKTAIETNEAITGEQDLLLNQDDLQERNILRVFN